MRRFLLLGAALSGVVLTGCVAGNGSAAVRFGPPPSPRYGVMGYAPGPGFVWTEGYWDWRGGGGVWGGGWGGWWGGGGVVWGGGARAPPPPPPAVVGPPARGRNPPPGGI